MELYRMRPVQGMHASNQTWQEKSPFDLLLDMDGAQLPMSQPSARTAEIPNSFPASWHAHAAEKRLWQRGSLAVVEAQGPVGRQMRATHNLSQLVDDSSRRGAGKHVEVQHASDHLPGDPVLLQNNVHAIAVEQQHPASRPICKHMQGSRGHQRKTDAGQQNDKL